MDDSRGQYYKVHCYSTKFDPKNDRQGRGGIAQRLAHLHPVPAAPGSILGIPNFLVGFNWCHHDFMTARTVSWELNCHSNPSSTGESSTAKKRMIDKKNNLCNPAWNIHVQKFQIDIWLLGQTRPASKNSVKKNQLLQAFWTFLFRWWFQLLAVSAYITKFIATLAGAAFPGWVSASALLYVWESVCVCVFLCLWEWGEMRECLVAYYRLKVCWWVSNFICVSEGGPRGGGLVGVFWAEFFLVCVCV